VSAPLAVPVCRGLRYSRDIKTTGAHDAAQEFHFQGRESLARGTAGAARRLLAGAPGTRRHRQRLQRLQKGRLPTRVPGIPGARAARAAVGAVRRGDPVPRRSGHRRERYGGLRVGHPGCRVRGGPRESTCRCDPALDCRRTAIHIETGIHPLTRVQGTLMIEFTLMPDGMPRFPRIIQAVPAGVFEGAAKTILLRSQFSRMPAGTTPVQCFMPYNFIFSNHTQDTIGDFAAELGYRRNLPEIAQAGDPYAQLV